MRVWLITGASSGIGNLLAAAVLKQGDCAALVGRDPTRMATLVDAFPAQAAAYRMDVADSTDVVSVVAQVEARFGRIDVLVNNAGYALIAGVEEASERQYRALFDVDLFGPIAMMRAVLPGMRRNRGGRIINISSMAGIMGSPSLGFYAAAKAAIGLLSESLAAETAGMGIKVTVIEPGAHATAMRANSEFGEPIADYDATTGQTRRMLRETTGAEPGNAAMAAQAILRIASEDDPPLHLPLGDDALERTRTMIARRQTILAEWETLIRSTWLRN